jgi:tRNA A-37 threonylcarbamoyl transferase component Bud32
MLQTAEIQQTLPMKKWQIDPNLVRSESARAFQTLESVFALRGEKITTGDLGATSRARIKGRDFYVKLYRKAGKGVRRWIGRSRLRGEWENLLQFQEWGIPCARLVAYGLEKRGPFFLHGAIVTEGLPETSDLAELAKKNDSRLKNPRWVSAVSQQVAASARVMHRHNFAHGDFKWRNLLVTAGEPPRLYLIDCPAGAFWFRPFLQYRKNKDIACLDKVAKNILTRTQRMRFYLDYLEKGKLSARDKKQLRHIFRFFDGRE